MPFINERMLKEARVSSRKREILEKLHENKLKWNFPSIFCGFKSTNSM